MPPKNNKRGPTQVAELIESAIQGTEHDSAFGADANVACAPSYQSRDVDGDRPLPQIQPPARDGRLAGGQSQSSQGHFCNTDMNNETGSLTNLDFNKGLFDTGNHATCQLGSGTNTQSLCIVGLSMGEQEQNRNRVVAQHLIWRYY